jgi:hypothetical protein
VHWPGVGGQDASGPVPITYVRDMFYSMASGDPYAVSADCVVTAADFRWLCPEADLAGRGGVHNLPARDKTQSPVYEAVRVSTWPANA